MACISKAVLTHLPVVFGNWNRRARMWWLELMDWLRSTLWYFEGKDLDMCVQGIKVNTTPSCNHKLVSQVPFGLYYPLGWRHSVGCEGERRWPEEAWQGPPCPVQFTFVVNQVTPCTFHVWWLLSAAWGSLRLLSSLILFLSYVFFFLFLGHFSHPYNSYELMFH